MTNMTTMDIIKKYIPLGVIALVVLVVAVLYFFPPNGRMVCELNSAPGNMTSTSTYVVDYSFWRVKFLKVTETVHSNNDEDLIVYRQALEEDLEKYKGLEYYDTKVEVDNRTLVNTITIDYKNIDRNKLKEIEKGFSNKLTRIRYLKNIYLKNGAICKNV